jgi:uncharacterized Tic20 family protein
MADGTNGTPDVNKWAFFLHLSQLLGLVVPLLGWVAPVVLWQLKKDELPGLDVHGKIVSNWILSALIYGVVCGVLVFLLIGIPLLAVLGLLTVIFPIVGAIKANGGEAWKYPLSIPFFK